VKMGSFAKRLKMLREKSGRTQKEIAEFIGVKKSTISMYEIGKREPDYETLKAICDIFDVDTDYMLGRKDRTTEEKKGMAVIIGNNIKRLLDEEDMKQYELAEILGVSESAVGKWVLGKASPRMGTIQAIADHFGLNSSDILGENSNFSVSREKRFLMDKIKKADGKQLTKIRKLMELIADEEDRTW
jgi:transcriptional regulator with XRE-family HTH domain